MATNQDKVKELIDLRNQAKLGGGEKRIESQHKKGKYTAGKESPCCWTKTASKNFDMFVTHRCNNFGMEKTKFLGDGVVTGQGTINGRIVFCICTGFYRIRRSTFRNVGSEDLQSHGQSDDGRSSDHRIERFGGARIQEGVNSLAGYAEIFERNILASGVIPRYPLFSALCRWSRILSCPDRLHPDDRSEFLHVSLPDRRW